MELIAIPNLKRQLDLQYGLNFLPIRFSDLCPDVEHVYEGCEQLLTSKKFEDALVYTLSIGNFLNHGGTKGNQYGFALKSLSRFADFKSNSEKGFSLLDMLAYTLSNLRGDEMATSFFPDDLTAIPLITEVSVKGLQAEVEILGKDVTRLQNQAKGLATKKKEGDDVDQEGGETVDPFLLDVDNFIFGYQRRLEDLQALSKEMSASFKDCLTKFGEKQNLDSEEFFLIIATFLERYADSLKKVEGNDAMFKKRRSLVKSMAAVTNTDKPSVSASGGAERGEGYLDVISEGADKGPALESNNPFGVGTGNMGQQRREGEEASLDDSSLSRSSSISSIGSAISPRPTPSPRSGIANTPPTPQRRGTSSSLKGGAKAANDKNLLLQQEAMDKVRAPHTEPPGRSGWLHKLSGGKSRKQKWDKRYCELSQTGYIHYYKKQGGKNAGSVFLRGAPISMNEDPCTFLIETCTQLLFICVNSNYELN